MSINNLNTYEPVSEQREQLLILNNDLLYGVYSLVDENSEEIKLDFLENVLTCYPNQLENLQGLDDAIDITIVNLGALRKGKIEVLNGADVHVNNPVLLSNGVIEFVEGTNKNGETKKHLISTMRDGGAADKGQRTTTAGRNSGDNLQKDLEREHIEESPFLGYDSEGNFTLATIDNSDTSKEILKKSIQEFLEKKYLSPEHENYAFVKKNFERNFEGIKYQDLGNILTEIIEAGRITTYSSESVESIQGGEKDMKTVSLGESQGKYFVYFDKENNTVEYRLLRTLKGFNDGFEPLSNRPSRLYLESENQFPEFSRIEKANEGYVPTIQYFAEQVKKAI
ncbi:MAG: hypothetical protein GY828_08360, partial [Candidatus Gracilibacteria bacterium]|nr:hypothetical protein [Candidatus Gracilibacteria bacterium]